MKYELYEQTQQRAAQLVRQLKAHSLRVATAESCTGGLLGDMLTAVAGVSTVYPGGIIAYSNTIKHRLLNVPTETLQAYGAVSWQTAEAMAQGTRERIGTEIGLATTGIAGPDGGSAEKPVGLVYLGLATKHGTWHEHHIWTGDRSTNKLLSVQRILTWLCEWLEESYDYC